MSSLHLLSRHVEEQCFVDQFAYLLQVLKSLTSELGNSYFVPLGKLQGNDGREDAECLGNVFGGFGNTEKPQEKRFEAREG